MYIYIRVFFFKQKPAYEMRISDWSSDVCASDLWKAPADVIESYRNAEKLIGSDPSSILRLPGAAATDDEWAGVYDRLDRPAKAEDYRIEGDHPLGEELGRASRGERWCQTV